MVTSLVPQVKLQDVHLVLLVITAQQGPEVILLTGCSVHLVIGVRKALKHNLNTLVQLENLTWR